VRIELLDPATGEDEVLRGWYRCRIAAARVDSADNPHLPFDLVRGQLEPDGVEHRRTWICRDAEGQVIGGVRLALPDDENRHTCDAFLIVHPDHRRRGAGRALLQYAAARGAGARHSMSGAAMVGSPGASFAAAAGAVERLRDTRSLLRLADVDASLLAGWSAGRGSRTDGYVLRRWRDRCPDELVEPYTRALGAMNDAPIGGDHLPVTFDAQRLRRHEAARAVRGQRLLVVCALAESTGEVVGLTELLLPSSGPRADQGDTAVPAARRGHGLGLWVKATMLTWLLAERPEITEVETWNATGNTHMRAVNAELGFVPVEEWWNYSLALS